MTAPVNPVLFFHPDGYRVARPDLKGRHSAGESFLSAFIAQTTHSEIYALCNKPEDFREFAVIVSAGGRQLAAREVTRADVATLRQQGLLNLADPQVAEAARTRSFHGEADYALCGVTHTISSRAILDAVADLVTAPVMPWDAIILTSRAVEQAVSVVLEHAEDRLRHRIGASRFIRPLLQVIPLGIHAHRFKRNDADRVRWRTQLKLDDDTIAILFFGRLSVHAKASPFQLAQAVEQAARSGRERYAMIWCGWFNDEFQRRAFTHTAKQMAPSVDFHYVDGRVADARFSIWSAADIFCSLSDNIQETFGLTVIEAMAAELPVVVSNWDGYRDTVKDGTTGVLIDTFLPNTSFADLAYRYISGLDTYDAFIGTISQFCIVDVEQTAQWISRLARDADLRRKFATAARSAAETEFDWSVVLPRYQELWNAQREMLEQARRDVASSSRQPQALDPAKIFAGFASHRLDGNTPLARGPYFDRWEELVNEPGVVLALSALLGKKEFLFIRDQIAAGPQSLDQMLAGIKAERRPVVLRSLHWMVKVGLLRVASRQ